MYGMFKTPVHSCYWVSGFCFFFFTFSLFSRIYEVDFFNCKLKEHIQFIARSESVFKNMFCFRIDLETDCEHSRKFP